MLRAAVRCSGSGGGSGGAPLAQQLRLLWSSGAAAAPATIEASSELEKQIAAKLAAGLQGAEAIRVDDTSGGCGAMFTIDVVAKEFAGHSIVKQHQLVTRLLKEDIGQWHGFQLTTRPPAATADK